MEAAGHEEITKEVAKFTRELIQLRYPNVYKRYFADEQQETDFEKAIYLGNWLTDNTQMFAPDAVFEAKMDFAKFCTGWNVQIDKLKKTFCTNDTYYDYELIRIIYESLLKRAVTELDIQKSGTGFFTTEVFNRLGKEIASKYPQVNISLPDALEQQIKKAFSIKRAFLPPGLQVLDDLFIPSGSFVSDAICDVLEDLKLFPETTAALNQLKQHNFVYDTRNTIWDFTYSVIKLRGYLKFCKPGELQPSIYQSVVSSFVDDDYQLYDNIQKPAQQSDKHYKYFKLNQYYPCDHLDRAFTNSKLALFGSTYNEKEHFIDNALDEEAKIYRYLADYRQICSGKIGQLAVDWVKPQFIQDKADSNNQFYINAARLGNTLHQVEDFFAHSNFLELVVYSLNDLLQAVPAGEGNDYLRKEEFIDKLSSIERGRYKRSFNAPKVAGASSTSPELNLATGYFAGNDMFCSLYHMAFDSIRELIRKPNYGNIAFEAAKQVPGADKFVSTDKLDAILYLSKVATWLCNPNQKEIRQLRSKGDVILGQKNLLTMDGLNFILGKNGGADDPLLTPEAKQYLLDAINSTYRMAVTLKYGAKAGYHAYKLVKSLKELKDVAYILRDIFTLITLPEAAGAALADIGRRIAKGIGSLLKETATDIIKQQLDKAIKAVLDLLIDGLAIGVEGMLGIHSDTKNGSHTIMAKDEAFHNENFNAIAKEAALFTDKLICLCLIGDTKLADDGTIKCVDFDKLLEDFLSHPNRYDKLEKSLAAQEELAEYYITVDITKSPYSIAQIYNMALNNRVQYTYPFILGTLQTSQEKVAVTPEKFLADFLRANPSLNAQNLGYADKTPKQKALQTKPQNQKRVVVDGIALEFEPEQLKALATQTTPPAEISVPRIDRYELPQMNYLPVDANSIYQIKTYESLPDLTDDRTFIKIPHQKKDIFNVLGNSVPPLYWHRFLPDGAPPLYYNWALRFFKKQFWEEHVNPDRNSGYIDHLKEEGISSNALENDYNEVDFYADYNAYCNINYPETATLTEKEILLHINATLKKEKQVKQNFEVFLRDFYKLKYPPNEKK